ncbi:hypothetical protein FKM82_017349 [Ascaphus truei]
MAHPGLEKGRDTEHGTSRAGEGQGYRSWNIQGRRRAGIHEKGLARPGKEITDLVPSRSEDAGIQRLTTVGQQSAKKEPSPSRTALAQGERAWQRLEPHGIDGSLDMCRD